MKTLVTAAAIVAFTAGTAAAMGGCGSWQSAAKTAKLDTSATKQESVAQTPAPHAAAPGADEATRVQTAKTPREEPAPQE